MRNRFSQPSSAHIPSRGFVGHKTTKLSFLYWIRSRPTAQRFPFFLFPQRPPSSPSPLQSPPPGHGNPAVPQPLAAPPPPQSRPRLLPAQAYHSRSYSSGESTRPMRQFSEKNESGPQPLIYYILPPFLLAVAGLATFVHYNDERRAVPLAKEAGQGGVPKRCITNRPAIGGPFKLYDTEKNVVTESELRGNWTLMYFGYTSCPDLGPRQVQKIADVVKVLESEYGIKIKPLFVTIDPQRDSSAQLKAYLSEFDPRIVGLTGPFSAVRQIAQEYRVFFKKVEEVGQDYLVESSHNMYLLDPCLETVRCFGTEYESPDITEAITKEVQKASAASTN